MLAMVNRKISVEFKETMSPKFLMWKTNTFIYCTVLGLNERKGIGLIFFLPPIASELSIQEKKRTIQNVSYFYILYIV
jgi:hypothetical protein